MSTSMLLGLFDWIGEFFTALFDLIPKVIYLLYSSLACVLDVLQLFFRKLAGLDVYYVDGKSVSGDLVTNFITGILGINPDGFTYSALSTVFWAFIVFGIIMCFITTIVAIVKSHYSYDEKAAKGPMQYVYTAGKAVLNMVAVPIIVVLGLYLSQAILTALDTITSVSSGTVVSMFGPDQVQNLESVNTTRSQASNSPNSKEKTYIFYDLFGYASNISYGQNSQGNKKATPTQLGLIGSINQTFSGSLFKVAAYNANRARLGQITPQNQKISGTRTGEIFSYAKANEDELLADMIDTAFGCNLHLKDNMTLVYEKDGGAGDWTSTRYFTNFLTNSTNAFSKFNVGLIWYYYDLWNYNYIVGFAACIICVTLFINIIMGLIARLFMCIGLFLIAPPLFGLAPLDGGKAGKSWQENFMKQVLMAYGAVVGMNIFFLILPYMNEIDFFNIAIADYFAQTLIIIVGLITIKAFIATVSGLIGAEDANKSGEGIAEDVGKVAGKAAKLTAGTIKAPYKIAKGGISYAKNRIQKSTNKKKGKDMDDLDKKEAYERFVNDPSHTQQQIRAEQKRLGISRRDANAIRSGNINSTLSRRQRTYQGLTAQQRSSQRATFKAREGAAGKRLKKAKKTFISGVLTPLSNINSVMGESKLYSSAKESSFWAKPDYQKNTWETTRDLLDETRGGRYDMRQGFEDVGGRVDTGFGATTEGLNTVNTSVQGVGTEVNSMHGDMNTGFASTNASLSGINNDMNSGFENSIAATQDVGTRVDAGTEVNREGFKKVTHNQKISHNTQKKQLDTERKTLSSTKNTGRTVRKNNTQLKHINNKTRP